VNTATETPLIHGIAWSGMNLIVTDPDLVDRKLRRKALSASTSKNMKGCLARYVGDKLLPREDDPFAVTELGTDTHAIIEDLYNMPNKDRTLDAFHALKDAHAVKKWTTAKLEAMPDMADPDAQAAFVEKWKGEVVRLGAPVFDIENPAEVTTYKTEMPFDGVTIAGGVPTMGYIDRVDIIVVREKNRFKVVDLKTGKMKNAFELQRYGDDHGDQIRIYADAINEVTGEPPAVGEIHYTQFGVSREISLSELNMSKTRKDFRDAWDIHNKVTDSGEFPTQTGALCGWCPLVNACPAAKAAGKTASDRNLKVPATAVQLGIPTVRGDAARPMGSKLPVTAPVPVQTPDAPKTRMIASAPPALAPEHIPYSDVAPSASEESLSHGLIESAALAAHVLSDTFDPNGIGTPTMTATSPAETLFSEGKPWEAEINGKLNGASYAAMAVTSIPQIAGELLIEAGRPLNSATLDRLTDLLAEIIVTVQKSVRAGTFQWDDGINTRIRGALRTTIETLPLPWDATEAVAWEKWQIAATKRTSVFIMKSLRLYSLGENIGHAEFDALLLAPVADISTKPKPGVQQVA
jgi:putative RecB family exonuclease